MATFTSLKDYAGALDKLKIPPSVMREMGVKMAKEAQKIATREASSDLGGDPKFSGWAPALETKVKPLRAGALISPTKTSAGPWTVAEFGRNTLSGPGLNARGRTSRRKDGSVIIRRRGGKRWNGITQGKGTASSAADQFEKAAEKIAEAEIRKHFRRGRIDVD